MIVANKSGSDHFREERVMSWILSVRHVIDFTGYSLTVNKEVGSFGSVDSQHTRHTVSSALERNRYPVGVTSTRLRSAANETAIIPSL